jgi:hypothetical protein
MGDPRQELARADRHIAHAEELIARQRKALDQLERDGHDASAETARVLLEAMIDSLEQMRAHRRTIERETVRSE